MVQDSGSFVRHMGRLFDALTWDQIAADTSGVIQVIARTLHALLIIYQTMSILTYTACRLPSMFVEFPSTVAAEGDCGGWWADRNIETMSGCALKQQHGVKEIN